MSTEKPIDVLVVDDSGVFRLLLAELIAADPRFRVVAAVADGAAALEAIAARKPDVVLMDIHMPVMDGFEATRRIMETSPLPIVICSATSKPDDSGVTFRMLEAGAVACVAKPAGPTHPEYGRMAAELCQTLRLMSEIRVVRRRARERPRAPAVAVPPLVAGHGGLAVIGIGASTGGPPAVQAILAALPRDFPVPILVVQHIAQGFLAGLVDWLRVTTGFPVEIAAHGVEPQAGHVYVAPDNFHLGVGAGGRLQLSAEAPESGLRPAVAHLFRSLATVHGPSAAGVLLTGMGADGAAELKLMRDCGAATIAQDRDTSIVHGMPGEAIKLGAATHVLPLEQIAGTLRAIAAQRG